MFTEARLPRGYEPSKQVRELVISLSEHAPLRILADGLAFHVSLLGMTALIAMALDRGWPWLWLLYPFVAVACARQLRALELIVHDAAHRNFIRSLPRLNDWSGDILFAAPVGQLVRRYWATHAMHHGSFGTSDDPCRVRMMQLFSTDPRSRRNEETTPRWLMRICRFYVTYTRNYYYAVARSGACALALIAWHGAAASVTAVAAREAGIAPGVWLTAWLLGWLVPLFVFLPLQRMLAEMGEHDYQGGPTELTATITNIGFWHRWLLHPWNDSFHLLHHLHPNIPQSRHRRAHRRLDAIDEHYRRRRIRLSVNGPIVDGR